MKICIVNEYLCVNEAHIVNIYPLDEYICIDTTRTEGVDLICLDPFDPDNDEDVALRDRIFDEILEACIDPTVSFVDPGDIAERIFDTLNVEKSWEVPNDE
jgi:hypothetical protein